ncbi:MAG: PilZ domain-containing protein [Nannocystaceae bacterium]
MAGDEDVPERRRAPRVAINAEFGALPETTYVSDLSEQGVFVHTDRSLPIGTQLLTRFTVLLDDPVVLEARGVVVRQQSSPPGLGVAFTEVSPEMVLRLRDAVARLRPRATPAPAPVRAPVPPPSTGQTRVTRPPIAPPEETKVVTAPPPSADPPVVMESLPQVASPYDEEAFEAHQTLVKLQAVDVEILDEDDDFDHDSGRSGPRRREP